ncbi:ExbD/TolR family protein [Ruegeria marina]|uniref:Biopolymer transport protein ExbD n=1 Tax=Ruegeria marina TaxID=639004 RepID=A0A1G7CW62_9RHOB|nr:biopolymer transporter ExbD [Ruegeria marina]SDE43491.1 biopolymer transport protein ExbD [Ruegeria marina]
MKPVRRNGTLPRVTLVPLIDVLFILLFYFMVTSVYLDLDMIPVSKVSDLPPPVAVGQSEAPLMLRLTPVGNVVVQGQTLRPDELTEWLQKDDRAVRPVLVLPSGQAPVQALASVMDELARAGVTRTRLIRIEGHP